MSNLGGKNVSEDTDKDLGVDGIVAGTNIDNIDSTDPRNPIINASAGGGETNTASNVGTGAGKVFKQKTGVDLELKSIKGGTDITISNDTSEVTINADSQLNNTTKGDLEGFSTVAARIPVGSNGQVLTADSAEALGLKWAAAAAGDPLTTKGDVFTFDTDAQRLAVGTNGQLLSADSAEATGLKWIAAPSGDPLTTKGDIMAFDTDADRVPIGTNDQVLTADSTNAFGLAWKDAAAGGAATVEFHGAKIEEESATARTATALINTFDVEVYDTDGFATLGTDNDRLTIPAGVTKVRLTSHIDATGVAAGTAGYSAISHFNSADALQREYGSSFTSGNTLRLHMMATPIIDVVAGDYFKLETDANDSSWSQIYVSLDIQYKDGTLTESAAVLTTKGDLLAHTTAPARLAVGTNDQVLTADSTASEGVAWKAAAAAAPQACRLTRTTDLTIDGNTLSEFTVEDYDDNGFADIGTNNERFTIPTGVTRVNIMYRATLADVNTDTDVSMTLDHLDSGLSTIGIFTMATTKADATGLSITYCYLGLSVSATDVIRSRFITADTSCKATNIEMIIQDVSP